MRTWSGSFLGFGAIAVLFGVVVSVSQLDGQAGQGARGRGNTPVERGKYLVDISGCHDCHSPKRDAAGHINEALSLSGRPASTATPSTTPGEIHTSLDLTAWTGPWGTTFASNLTPDPKTGLVSRKYTEASFLAMFRTGKKPLGGPIMPPMPWEMYNNMTDEDIKAMWAYLQTIKPIANLVPAPLLAPPPKGK